MTGHHAIWQTFDYDSVSGRTEKVTTYTGYFYITRHTHLESDYRHNPVYNVTPEVVMPYDELPFEIREQLPDNLKPRPKTPRRSAR